MSDNVFVPSHDRFGLGIEKVIDNAPLRLCACVGVSHPPTVYLSDTEEKAQAKDKRGVL